MCYYVKDLINKNINEKLLSKGSVFYMATPFLCTEILNIWFKNKNAIVQAYVVWLFALFVFVSPRYYALEISHTKPDKLFMQLSALTMDNIANGWLGHTYN